MTSQEATDRYCAFFESLSPQSLEKLDDYFDASAHFKDPFNDVRGIAQIRRVFVHMYTQVHEPAFEILDSMSDGDISFMRWRFSFSLRKQGEVIRADGVSRVMFDANGKVVEHIDYWDPVEGVYRHLPVFGSAFRWLTRRLKTA